jgi:hypothetical protein
VTTGSRLLERRGVEADRRAEGSWEITDPSHDAAGLADATAELAMGLAWVRHLEREDVVEMLDEIRAAVDEGEDYGEILVGWRMTALQLSDPARRLVLLGDDGAGSYDEVPRPE